MNGALAAVLASILLVACSQSDAGVYTAQGFAALDKIELTEDGKALMTADGETIEGTYSSESDKITITIEGESNGFIKDGKGCIDGGDFVGKYCKA